MSANGEMKQYRVIIFKEDGVFIAQCLEHDISAFAPDRKTLRKRFEGLFAFERNLSIERGGEPFAGINPAPKRFHDMWEGHKRPNNMVIAQSPVVMALAA